MAMSMLATQRLPVERSEEAPPLSAMAFIADPNALPRISADLFGLTLGKASIRE